MRTVRISKFEAVTLGVIGFMLFLMLGACAKEEPFHKHIDIPAVEETPGITATFDYRTSGTSASTRPRVVITATRTNNRPAAS